MNDGEKSSTGDAHAATAAAVDGDGKPSTDDVLRERARAFATEPDAGSPIVLRDLQKRFPPADGNPEKVAVQNLSLVVPKGECFGLLGPNGAGKTSSINMVRPLPGCCAHGCFSIDMVRPLPDCSALGARAAVTCGRRLPL